MKKIFLLLLVVVMCFSIASCGGDKEASKNNVPQTDESGSLQETTDSNPQEETVDLPDDLVGTWKNENMTLTLNKDGTGHFATQDGTIDEAVVLWDVWDIFVNVYFDGYDAERGDGDLCFTRMKDQLAFTYHNLANTDSITVPQPNLVLAD